MENKIRTVIIEDEKEDLDLMKNLLAVFNNIEICTSASDVESGIAAVSHYKPALIFLDIRLYGRLSFDILDAIYELKLKPKVIFTTAYDDYMGKAFKYAAFDYLLKPIDREELKNTLMRFVENTGEYDFDTSYHKLKTAEQKTVFNTAEGYEVIKPEDILYASTVKNKSYTEIFLKTGAKVTVTKNIGEVEKLLVQNYFYKIHRSYILNLNYVRKVNRIKHICLLQCNDVKYEIPISAEKTAALKEKINEMN